MPEGNSIMNLGEISKPATVLIEKISEAVGGYFKPYQIKRVAKAEAEAEIIKAQAQIEITDLEHRALQRFVAEEAIKQDNIEKITQKAIPHLTDSAAPEKMENDWIANFFDKCRIVSDEEMQSLWAKVLAGEANFPGSYSKRTVDFLNSLDKTEANLFTTLCGYGWSIGVVVPLIYDVESEIYNSHGINFSTLTHLDDIGLITFEHLTGFLRKGFPKRITIFYYGEPLIIEFSNQENNALDIGKIILTNTGQQLSRICGSEPIDGFLDYIIKKWAKENLILSSPYPRNKKTPNKKI
jgi:hypothetical protein